MDERGAADQLLRGVARLFDGGVSTLPGDSAHPSRRHRHMPPRCQRRRVQMLQLLWWRGAGSVGGGMKRAVGKKVGGGRRGRTAHLVRVGSVDPSIMPGKLAQNEWFWFLPWKEVSPSQHVFQVF